MLLAGRSTRNRSRATKAGSQVGDTFLAGSELQRFGILAIDAEAPGVLAGHADAIWIVEPPEEIVTVEHRWQWVTIATVDGPIRLHWD
jgi:hypothetical protein